MSLLDDIKRIKATNKPKPKGKTKPPPKCQQPPACLSSTKSHISLQSNVSCQQIKNTKSYMSLMKEQSSQQQDSSHELFNSMTFCFPIVSLELTAKRKQILCKIIKKNKGHVLSINAFISELKNQSSKQNIHIIITSRKDGIEKILAEFVELRELQHKITFIDYQYISICQKMNTKLDLSLYSIDTQSNNHKYHPQQHQQLQLETRGNKKVKVDLVQHTDHQYSPRLHSYQSCQDEGFDELSTQTYIQSTLSQVESTDAANILKAKTITVNEIKEYQILQANSPKITRTQRKYRPDKNKFICQSGRSHSQYETNKYICDQLQKLQSIYENDKDVGRKLAYMKAVSAIKSYPKQIQSQRDIAELRGIGIKISKKIKELLETGKIEKLQKLKQEEQNISCSQLCRVWGIGPNRAKQLFSKGITTIEALSNHQELLNKNQRIGLKYLTQFQIRIKRQKAQKIFNYVKQTLLEITDHEPLHYIEICGSYRRGKSTCGDVDIIISRKDGKFQPGLLFSLISELEKKEFLTDHLSLPSRRKICYDRSITYMGACMLPEDKKIHHRIDLKYYPLDQYAYAILYFTGSDMFNRSMRLYARKLGYSLSDRGICLVDRTNSSKVKIGENIAASSEKEIFQILSLEFKEPWERNV